MASVGGAGALAATSFAQLVGQYIFGNKTKLKDMRSPQQKQLDEARLGASVQGQNQLRDELQGMNREDFKKRRRAEFELNKIPEIEERFSKYGNTRSGDFNTALARAERENEVALDKSYYETLRDLIGKTAEQPLSQGFLPVPTKGQALATATPDLYKSVGNWIQQMIVSDKNTGRSGSQQQNQTDAKGVGGATT